MKMFGRVATCCGGLLVFSFLVLGAGCGDDEKKGNEYTFAWIPKELNNPVFETGRDGAVLKARELTAAGPDTVSVLYSGTNSAADIAGQAQLVADAVASGVDGIGISCNNAEGLEDAIDDAVAAGVPVMTWDSDSPSSDRFTYLGVNNKEGGRVAARILAAVMAETGKTQIALLSGVQTAANLSARIEGFQEELAASYPNLEIVHIAYCDDNADTGAAMVEQTMEDYPNLGGWFFVGLWPLLLYGNDPTRTDVLPLWGAAARSGAVKTVVFDTLDFQLDFMAEGMVQGLIGQKYWGWGYDTVQMLYDRVTTGREFDDWTDSGMDIVCPNNWAEMDAMWTSSDFTQSLTPCEYLD